MQLLRVGTFAVLGIPGELTTMAGRRLRTTVLDAMSAAGVRYVALGTYANEYSQYVTTIEEYASQQYEGASTLFGPHTLAAYQQVAAGLATAIAQRCPDPRRARSDSMDLPTAAPLPLPEPLGRGGHAPLLQHRRLARSCSRSPTATRRSTPRRRSPTPSGSSPARRCRPSSGSRSG